MRYNQTVILKNGKQCLLRNCEAADAKAVYDNFNVTHRQTDFLLSYYSAVGAVGTGAFSYPIQSGKFTVSSPFGFRADPSTGKFKMHNGVDFAAASGTPIYSSESGTVYFANFGLSGSGFGGYGNVVAIRHFSSLVSLYGHCSKLLVSTGQTVQKGQIIALVGSTGDSTGNHCHFEIRLNGKAVDPMKYLN